MNNTLRGKVGKSVGKRECLQSEDGNNSYLLRHPTSLKAFPASPCYFRARLRRDGSALSFVEIGIEIESEGPAGANSLADANLSQNETKDRNCQR